MGLCRVVWVCWLIGWFCVRFHWALTQIYLHRPQIDESYFPTVRLWFVDVVGGFLKQSLLLLHLSVLFTRLGGSHRSVLMLANAAQAMQVGRKPSTPTRGGTLSLLMHTLSLDVPGRDILFDNFCLLEKTRSGSRFHLGCVCDFWIASAQRWGRWARPIVIRMIEMTTMSPQATWDDLVELVCCACWLYIQERMLGLFTRSFTLIALQEKDDVPART